MNSFKENNGKELKRDVFLVFAQDAATFRMSDGSDAEHRGWVLS